MPTIVDCKLVVPLLHIHTDNIQHSVSVVRKQISAFFCPSQEISAAKSSSKQNRNQAGKGRSNLLEIPNNSFGFPRIRRVSSVINPTCLPVLGSWLNTNLIAGTQLLDYLLSYIVLNWEYGDNLGVKTFVCFLLFRPRGIPA